MNAPRERESRERESRELSAPRAVVRLSGMNRAEASAMLGSFGGSWELLDSGEDWSLWKYLGPWRLRESDEVVWFDTPDPDEVDPA